jgi:hypothetical protein
MVERVKPRALLINGNDASGAVRVAFASTPREDKAVFPTTLQAPAPPRLRWLEPPPLPRALPSHNSSGCEAAGPSGVKTNMGRRSAGFPQPLAQNFACCCCG